MPLKRDLMIVAAINYTGMIVQFGTSLLLARLLGVEIYGIFAATLAAWNILLAIADFGLSSAGARLVAISDDVPTRNKILANVILIRIIVGLITAIFAVAWASYYRDAHFRNAFLFGFPMLLGASLNVTWYLQGMGKGPQAAWPQLAAKLGICLVIAATVHTGQDLILATFLMASIPASAAAVNLKQVFQTGMRLSYFRLTGLLSTVRQGAPLVATQVTIQLYTSAVLVIAAANLTLEASSNIAAADRLIKLYFMVIAPATLILLPKLAQLLKEGVANESDKFFQSVVRAHVLAAVAFGMTLLIFSGYVTNTIYGRSYIYADEYLRWMCALPLFSAISHSFGTHGLIANGNNLYFFFSAALGAILALSSIYPLIARYGPLGYVLSLYVAEASVALSTIILYRRSRTR